MRFSKQVLFLLLVSSLSCAWHVEAFAPYMVRQTAAAAVQPSRPSSSSLLLHIGSRRRHSALVRFLAADDDDDDDDDEDDHMDDPLSKGVDSVAWLPSVADGRQDPLDLKTSPKSSSSSDDSEVLPLFPLGGIVYTPNSEHVLNIFEKRYREMYSDILMNGTKRFVVSMSHPNKQGVFAATGVLFELQDLKEVSEQTADQIKYICNHKVTGRVQLKRILNPEAWATRDTYLRVEGLVIDDSGRSSSESSSSATTTTAATTQTNASTDNIYGTIASAASMGSNNNNPLEENKLRTAFGQLVELQHELEEDVRFTKGSVPTLAVKPGAGEDCLWQTIRLWQSFADQRLMVRQSELQQDFQEKLLEFLKTERGLKDSEIPSAIGFEDLSAALKQEVSDLRKRMTVELQPLVLESTLTMQKILEAKDHTARVQLLRHFIEAETRRLLTKKALKGMFKGGAAGDSKASVTGMPPEEQVRDDDSPKKKVEELKKSMDSSSSKPSSIFADEPDAFQ